MNQDKIMFHNDLKIHKCKIIKAFIIVLIFLFTNAIAKNNWNFSVRNNKNKKKEAQNIFTRWQYKPKNYYFSSSTGNDSYTPTQAQHPATPWKSIYKLNSIINILNGGDSVLFKRGDIFFGTIIINKSGWNNKAKIIFGSYGKGLQPEINGLETITNWVKTKGNLWYAKCNKYNTFMNNLLINGIPQQIGRYPNPDSKNKGYLTITAHVDKMQIRSDDLIDNIDWIGAEVVIRNKRWNLDKTMIKLHKNKILTLSNPIKYEPKNGFGFFIQNNINTLDTNGEWFYDMNNNTIHLYLTSNPNSQNIQISVLPTLVKIANEGNITIENITLNGAQKNAIQLDTCYSIDIKKTRIINSGTNGIYSHASYNISVLDNFINKTNNIAIVSDYCNKIFIKNNTIKNTAIIAGMGLEGENQSHAMMLYGFDYFVEQNIIDSVGHSGIVFCAHDVSIKNNLISNFCLNKDDGGGIYTYSDGSKTYFNQKIIGNIISNGKGAPEGTPLLDYVANGIYIDDRSSNIDITDNTIFHCSYSGIYIHNANHVNITRNTVYDNKAQIRFVHDSIENTFPITNCETVENIFLSKTPVQHSICILSVDGNISDIGKFNHNYYYILTKDSNNIIAEYNKNNIFHREVLSLQGWKKKYLKDIDSKIDSFRHDAFRINNLLTKNLIFNEELNNLHHWHCWSVYDNGNMLIDKKNRPLGLGMKLLFNSLSAKPNSKMVVISNLFSVKKRKNYLMQFSAKSSNLDAALVVSLKKNEAPYNLVLGETFYKLDTIAHNYQHVFSIDSDVATEARIDFEIIENPNVIWIGNIELYEADVTLTNPDDYFRFEYNPENQVKTIILDKEYFDYNGKIYNNNVVLEPFSSIVLFKKIDFPDILITDFQEFKMVKEKTIAKHLINICYIVLIFLVLFFFAIYFYRTNKIFLLIGINLLVLFLVVWIYFSRLKPKFEFNGNIKFKRKCLVINNNNYNLDSINNICININGYKGQRLFPYRSHKNRTDGSNNFIKIKTLHGPNLQLRFQIDNYSDIDKLKKIVNYWKYAGHDITISIAVDWI